MNVISLRFKSIFTAAVLTGSLFFTGMDASAVGELESQVDDVYVSDVEELYTAVNDPQNSGARVILSPGTYALSRFDGSGQLRPNDGRLELQTNMSLHGVEGDRSAVVIEAIGLPTASLSGGSVPLGAIRVGRGRNALEWLTVRNARGGQGNIVTTLDDGNTFYFRVAHIASTGSGNNLSIGNLGAASAGRTIEADIVDNDLFDGFGTGFRQGFRIRNDGNGSIINVRLSGNRVWGNGFNLIINAGSAGAVINVFSSGNRYFDNGGGLFVVGGLSGAVGNTINYTGHGDHFVSNDEPGVFDQGGLLFFGGDRLAAGTLGASGNTVNAKLFGCRMSGNAYADLAAIGGRSLAPAFISTVFDNRVILELNGMPVKENVVELFADSLPEDTSTNNSVTVIR
jgi:hypothetical protein